MSSALVRQSTYHLAETVVGAQATSEELLREHEFYQPLREMMAIHEPHGVDKLTAGCKICIFRAAWKVQHEAPSRQAALKFLVNISIEEINNAISDVKPFHHDQKQVHHFVEGELMMSEVMTEDMTSNTLDSSC